MRGQLQIKSDRAPYLRGGLSFGEDRTVEIALVDLGGARFLELIRDPVLTIFVFREGEGWQLLPVIDPEATAEDLQMMIDAVRDGLVEIAADATGEHPVDGAVEIAYLRSVIVALEHEVEDLSGKLKEAEVELGRALGELAAERAKIVTLELNTMTPAVPGATAADPSSSAAGIGDGETRRGQSEDGSGPEAPASSGHDPAGAEAPAAGASEVIPQAGVEGRSLSEGLQPGSEPVPLPATADSKPRKRGR